MGCDQKGPHLHDLFPAVGLDVAGKVVAGKKGIARQRQFGIQDEVSSLQGRLEVPSEEVSIGSRVFVMNLQVDQGQSHRFFHGGLSLSDLASGS